MTVQVNKRNLRILLLILLIALAALLVLRNLQEAHHLSAITPPPPQQLYKKLEPLESFADLTEDSLLPLIASSTEEPRVITSRTRELQQLLKCRNRRLRIQKVLHGDYWVVNNLIVGLQSRRMDCAESITYTTNGDFTFFDNLETVASRWKAPISFAIHSPGYDLNSTLDAIQYVRNCLPGSQLIRDFVSFHVFFSVDHMPDYVPFNEEEALQWPYKCVEPPPYHLQNRSTMYKVQANLTYPINVGRNIARQAVNTHFIFACDVELYPSLGFVDQFLDMVHRNSSVLALRPEQPRRVYPLPVFEVYENESIPNNKVELLNLFRRKRAQLFHAKVCATCHKVPGYMDWMQQASNMPDQLELFSMTLRQGDFKYWEPFYVSDNTEPFFDERVTWEGQSNKRIQGYAMCLLGYEYHVLHPAFLVHSPGIKRPEKNSTRAPFVKEMNKFIRSKIEPEYRVLYGKNKKCLT